MLNYSVERFYGPDGARRVPLEYETKTEHFCEQLFRDKYSFPARVGIEVELENIQNGTIDPNLWRLVPDNSLRNKGYEAVSYPLAGNEILLALAALHLWYEKNPKSEFSHRCSIHVHLEAVELTMEQLYVLVGTYMSVENLIFNSLFPTRKGNNYCFPLNNVLLEKQDLDRVRLNKETWKYAALNLYHLRDFGTLEFRHHPGTKSVHELLKWIQILGNLYTWAQKTSLKDFKTLLMNLNTTSEYMEYVHQALPNLSAKVCTDDMYHAVTAAKVFVNSIKG